jgi:hypothetical protein
MRGKRLIRVNSEAEIRVGMIVVIKGCITCRRSHRGALVSVVMGLCRCGCESGWTIAPSVGHHRWLCLRHYAIPAGRLYRVDDGLESPEEMERARKSDETGADRRLRTLVRQKNGLPLSDR